MKVSRKALTEFMLNAAQDTISTVVGRLSRIRRADAGAVTESIGFLDESTTLKEFLENLYQFTAAGNGQLIVQPSVFGEANATKVRELTALAKRSGVRLYIDLSGSDAGIEQYRDHGFAGYLKKDALFNFLSVPKNAESVTAGIVEVPANVEAREFPDALKKALRSSEKEFKIIRLAQVADYLRQERSTEGRMAITDILRMPVLSIFAPEQINETYVQRVAYNWPREKLPLSDTAIEPDIDAEVLQKMIEADPDVQTYLLKLKKDIRGTKQENNYAALSGIFIETMTERRLAQAALSKDMNGAPLADEDMERALGYLLKIRNRDTKAVFDQDLIDDMTNDDRKSTEEVLAAITSYVAQVRQKQVRTGVEVATAIELLVAYAERKHAETIKKKEQGFDANSVKAILKAA
jgi:hypothetical protein